LISFIGLTLLEGEQMHSDDHRGMEDLSNDGSNF